MESSTNQPITAARCHVRDYQRYAIARREIGADSCPRGLVERGDLELAFAGVHKALDDGNPQGANRGKEASAHARRLEYAIAVKVLSHIHQDNCERQMPMDHGGPDGKRRWESQRDMEPAMVEAERLCWQNRGFETFSKRFRDVVETNLRRD